MAYIRNNQDVQNIWNYDFYFLFIFLTNVSCSAAGSLLSLFRHPRQRFQIDFGCGCRSWKRPTRKKKKINSEIIIQGARHEIQLNGCTSKRNAREKVKNQCQGYYGRFFRFEPQTKRSYSCHHFFSFFFKIVLNEFVVHHHLASVCLYYHSKLCYKKQILIIIAGPC